MDRYFVTYFSVTEIGFEAADAQSVIGTGDVLSDCRTMLFICVHLSCRIAGKAALADRDAVTDGKLAVCVQAVIEASSFRVFCIFEIVRVSRNLVLG